MKNINVLVYLMMLMCLCGCDFETSSVKATRIKEENQTKRLQMTLEDAVDRENRTYEFIENEAKLIRDEQDRLAKEQRELELRRKVALHNQISNKVAYLSADYASMTNALEEIKYDKNIFDSTVNRIESEFRNSDKNGNPEYRLYNMLNDECIAELGKKYANLDMEIEKNNFVDAVKQFKKYKAEYDDKIKASNERFDKEVRNKKAIIADKTEYIKKMQNELSQLERRLEDYNSSHSGFRSNVRRIGDDLISKTKQRADRLRHDITLAQAEVVSYASSLSAMSAAGRKIEDYGDAGEKLGSAMSLHVLVKQCTDRTVDAVRNSMSTKMDILCLRSNELLTEIKNLNEFAFVIDGLSLEEVESMKKDLDRKIYDSAIKTDERSEPIYSK